jgi:hypothetical protein
MKRRILFTFVWMICSAAFVAGLGLATMAVLQRTAHEVDPLLYASAVFGVLLLVAPLVALILGLIGVLPGTQRKDSTNAA